MLRAFCLVLLLAVSGCAGLPAGRPAETPLEHLLFGTDPQKLRVAIQSNMLPGTFTLYWSASDKASETVMSEGELALVREAHGREVGFDLPAARRGQQWSVWTVDDADAKALRDAQRAVRAARASDDALAYTAGFNWGSDKTSETPAVIFTTYAIHTPDRGWVTLIDNAAMVPEGCDEQAD